jgi:hypothetical protein
VEENKLEYLSFTSFFRQFYNLRARLEPTLIFVFWPMEILKKLLGTNTLAYFAPMSMTKKEFDNIVSSACTIKFFLVVIDLNW